MFLEGRPGFFDLTKDELKFDRQALYQSPIVHHRETKFVTRRARNHHRELLPVDRAKTELVVKFFTACIASFHRKAPRSMAGVNFEGESNDATQTVSLRPDISKNRKFYSLRFREIWGVLMSYYGRPAKSYAEKLIWGDRIRTETDIAQIVGVTKSIYFNLKLRAIKSVWLRIRASLSRMPVKRSA